MGVSKRLLKRVCFYQGRFKWTDRGSITVRIRNLWVVESVVPDGNLSLEKSGSFSWPEERQLIQGGTTHCNWLLTLVELLRNIISATTTSLRESCNTSTPVACGPDIFHALYGTSRACQCNLTPGAGTSSPHHVMGNQIEELSQALSIAMKL